MEVILISFLHRPFPNLTVKNENRFTFAKVIVKSGPLSETGVYIHIQTETPIDRPLYPFHVAVVWLRAAGSGVEKIGPIRFLVGCGKGRLPCVLY